MRPTLLQRNSASPFLRGQEPAMSSLWTYQRPSKQHQLDANNGGAWLHPHPLLAKRKRKSVVEWRMHYGHGHRVGTTGVMRLTPDWEHSDGTPAPHSNARHATRFHHHHMLEEIIRAGAVTEMRLREGAMPKVPSSAAQRDWDPEIPLFLEDADERGGGVRPEWFEQPRKLFAQSRKNKWMPDIPEEAGYRSAEQREIAKDTGKLEQFKQEKERPLENLASSTAEYRPASFIDEPLYLREKKRTPWNRRLWALTDEFLITKPPRNKNTIGSD